MPFSARDKNSLCQLMIALMVTAFVSLVPMRGESAESLEGRWEVKGEEADLQFEFQDGRCVARVLDNVEDCGLTVCEVVFRGAVDASGIVTGEVRSCGDKNCICPNWNFTMGKVSPNGSQLEFFGAGIHVGNCKDRGENSPGVNLLMKKSSQRVDCVARRYLEDVRRRIRPKMEKDEAQPLLDEVKSLSDRYSSEQGNLLILRGRILAALGTPRGVKQAKSDFEQAANVYGKSWAQCELAMLAANPLETSQQDAGALLMKCHQVEKLTCHQLKSPRMEPLRSQKEFWSLWKNLDCGNRP